MSGLVLILRASTLLSAVNPLGTVHDRAGWSLQYPPGFVIRSCNQCRDPTDPHVFVALFNKAVQEHIFIEHLIDKPAGYTDDQWFDDLKQTTNINPRLREEKITIDRSPALRVIYEASTDLDHEEMILVVRGRTTF